MQGRFIYKAATLTTDTGTADVMDTDGDIAVVDVADLTGISLYVNQIEDAGNATLTIEKTIDGTNWCPVGTAKTQADFAAGVNKAIEVTLSDSNGMPLSAKQLRVTLSGHTSTGKYTVGAAGTQRDGYR